MAELGPIAKFFFGAEGENWKTPARQLFPGFNPNRRPVQVEEAVNPEQRGSIRVDTAVNQALGEAPSRPVNQLTPQQQADWQAVGLGQMKIGEFRAKHGFVPAPAGAPTPNDRGLFSR